MRDKKRILFISEALPCPPVDGRRIPVFHLLRHLASRYQIDLLAFCDPGETVSEQARAWLGEHCANWEVFPQVPLSKSRIAAHLVANQPRSLQRYRAPGFPERLSDWVSSRDYAIAHFFGINVAQFVDLVTPLPTVLASHDCVSHALRRRSHDPRASIIRRWDYGREARLMQYYERALAQKFSRWYVVSPVDQEALQVVCPTTRVDLIPNGVDAEYFAPLQKPDLMPNLLVMSGGFQTQRDIDAVNFMSRQVLPRVKQVYPNARLLLAGGQPHPDVCSAVASNPHLEMTGFADDLRPHIARGKVYVCGLNAGTGVKNRVLEALAMAKATVTTSVGAEGLDLKHGKHFLVADDPAKFAEHVVRLLGNPQLCTQLGTAARAAVMERYSWESAASQVVALYNEIEEEEDAHKQLSGSNA